MDAVYSHWHYNLQHVMMMHTLLSSQYCILNSSFFYFHFTLLIKHSCILQLSFTHQQKHNRCRHHCGLSSTHSFSEAIIPELRPLIFPNEFTLDNPLKLLLLPSFMLRNFLDLLGLKQVVSTPSRSMSSWVSTLITISLDMALRQNGQMGGVGCEVEVLALLWQQSVSVHCAHIWWPQSWTSIVHTCSKQMQHNSVSLTWKLH